MQNPESDEDGAAATQETTSTRKRDIDGSMDTKLPRLLNMG